MNLSFSSSGLRKLINLFKRSEPKGHNEQRNLLFPLLPSCAVPPTPQRKTAIIAKLIQQALATPAQPVLCLHTVTVTATSHSRSTSSLTSLLPADQQVAEHVHSGDEGVEIDSVHFIEHVEDGTEYFASPLTFEHSSQVVTSIQEDLEAKDNSIGDVLIRGNELDIHDGFIGDRLTEDCLVRGNRSNIHECCSLDLIESHEHHISLSKDIVVVMENLKQTKHHILASKTLDSERSAVTEEECSNEDLFEGEIKALSFDSSSESLDEDEDDANFVYPDVLRADWAPIRAISEYLFRMTLLQHLPADHGIDIENVCCTDEIQGGNSFVRILEVDDGVCADRYIVKVPCVGTAARWQECDAYMLRSDARTMSYIFKHTTVPCPEVLGFSDELTNLLGAPYIVMRANKGMPANKIWFDQDKDGDDDLVNAHLPDEGRVGIRVNFLRSLATQMAKLQALEFDLAGTLDFDNDPENPTIGPTYHWKTVSEMEKLTIHDMSTPECINCIPAYRSSDAYFMTALNEHWPRDEDTSGQVNNGRRHIMQRMLISSPFFESKKVGDKKETFVLRHDDLDFQNILCDEEGNVTGIIDWDKARAAPRCIGYASLPAFLTKDWTPKFSTFGDIHMPWDLDEYRNVYACAMLEAAGSNGAGNYTIKSALYEAVNAALYGGHNGGSVSNLVRRILKELPSTRMFDDMDILTALGRGDWDQGVGRVNKEIVRMIAPQSQVEVVEPYFWVDPDN